MWAVGASLVVQYLRFHALNAGVRVWVRVRFTVRVRFGFGLGLVQVLV